MKEDERTRNFGTMAALLFVQFASAKVLLFRGSSDNHERGCSEAETRDQSRMRRHDAQPITGAAEMDFNPQNREHGFGCGNGWSDAPEARTSRDMRGVRGRKARSMSIEPGRRFNE